MSKTGLYLSFLTILCFSILSVSLIYRIGLPYVYYIFSFLASLFVVFLIAEMEAKSAKAVLFLIVGIFIFIRLAYGLSRLSSSIPLSDPYVDFTVVRTLIEQGHLPTATNTHHIGLFESEWPIPHTLAASLSAVTGLGPLQVVLLLPLVFGLSSLLFVYMFAGRVFRNLGLSNTSSMRAGLLFLLIFSVSVENVYLTIQFTRQNLAFVFYSFIIYFMLYSFSLQSFLLNLQRWKWVLISLLFMSVLVMTHNFTPFIMLLFLAFFLLSSRVINWISPRLNWISPRLKWTTSISGFSVVMILFLSVALFVWLGYGAPSFWREETFIVQNLWEELQTSPLRFYNKNFEATTVRTNYYDILSPEPYTSLLTYRGLAMYATAALGFVLVAYGFIRKKKIYTIANLLLLTIVAFLLIAFCQFVILIQPLRVVWFAAPIIALFAGFFYQHLLSNKRNVIRAFVAFSLVGIVFVSFLSPWSYSYFPLEIYTSIEPSEAGAHSRHVFDIEPFIAEHISIDNYDNILSDDAYLLLLIMPVNKYDVIQDVYGDQVSTGKNRIIFEFMHLNPPISALPYVYKDEQNVASRLELLRQQILRNNTLVYNSGYTRIYVNNDQSTLQG